MPKISVVLPTYNRAKYLPRALDSVLNQTFQDFEIIIIDDGSTDNTKEVAAAYIKGREDKIKYFYQDNKGVASARNTGIRYSVGEFIAFIDSDDLWTSRDKLEKQIKFLIPRPDCCMVFTDMSCAKNNKILFKSHFKRYKYHFNESNIYRKLLLSNFIYIQTVVIRKKCFDEVGFFNESYRLSSDYNMWLRITRSKKTGFIKEVTVVRNFQEDNLWNKPIPGYMNGIKLKSKLMETCVNDKSELKLLRESLSRSYSGLAGAYFNEGEIKKARENFIKSFKVNKNNFASLACFFLTFTPLAVIKKIKPIKEFLKVIIFFIVISEILFNIILLSPGLRYKEYEALYRRRWVGRCMKKAGIYYKYGIDIYHPSRGWALRPNLYNLNYRKDKVINSNSKGVRGNIEYSYDKMQDKTRILILGDSFTFGEECSDNETYPDFLRALMPALEVINFGVHGYGHDQMLIYLKEEGLKYTPDIVMVGFISYDTARNMLSFRDYAKPKFEVSDGKLFLRNSIVPPPEEVLKDEVWRLRPIDLLSVIYNCVLKRIGYYGEKEKIITDAILNEMIKTIRETNAVPIFLYLTDVRNTELPDAMTQEEQDFFEHWQELGVECVFLRPYFKAAQRQGIKIDTRGHFNMVANKIIAIGIKAYLIDHGIVHGD